MRRKLIRSLPWGEEEAEKEARALAKECPDYWGSWKYLSEILEMRGKKEEAQEAFNHLFSDFPVYAETYYALGKRLADFGQYTEALAAYRKASSMKQPNRISKLGEAKMLVQLGDTDSAVRVYAEIIAQDPKRTDSCQLLDELLRAKKNTEERVATWRRVCADLPNADLPALFFSTSLEETGRVDEAVIALEEILQRDPNSTSALEALKRCRSEKGDAFEKTK
jgi:tetratricopeptide (TPR) repeat protein